MPPRRSKRKRDTNSAAADDAPADDTAVASAAAAAEGGGGANEGTVAGNAAAVAPSASAAAGAAAAAGSTASAAVGTTSRQSSAEKKKKKAYKSKRKSSKKDIKTPSNKSKSSLLVGKSTSFADIITMKQEKQVLLEATSTTTTSIISPPLQQTSLLSNLLVQIQTLSKNKNRCSAALQALVDGNVAYTTFEDYTNNNNNNEDRFAPMGGHNMKARGGNKAGSNNNNNNRAGKATDYAPNLASFAAALAGEHVDFYSTNSTTTVASSTTTAAAASSKGKKKKKKAEKKKTKTKGGTNVQEDGGEEYGRQRGSHDAHLIMAVTQAVNVLLANLKEAKSNLDAAAAPSSFASDSKKDTKSPTTPSSKKPAAKKTRHPPPPSFERSSQQQSTKQMSIMLLSLSHPLLTSLVNDRTLLETITKASRAASSSSSGGSPRHGTSSGQHGGGHVGGSKSIFVADAATDEDVHRATNTSSPERAARAAAAALAASGVDAKRMVLSHAKSVVGRGLTSGVMGALWGLDTLARMGVDETFNTSTTMDGEDATAEEDGRTQGNDDDDDDDEDGTEEAILLEEAERSILAKCLWTALSSLEISFQLAPKPKLLMTSSVASPITPSSGIAGMASSVASAASSSRGGGGLMDFDHLLSAAIMATTAAGGDGNNSGSSSDGGGSAGHAHLTMGSDTISMWNGMLQCILLEEYRVEFQYLTSSSPSPLLTTALPTGTGGTGGEKEAIGMAMAEKENAKKQAENDYLAKICSDVSSSLFDEEEDDCDSKFIVLALEGIRKMTRDAPSSSNVGGGGGGEPPRKRGRTASATTAAAKSRPRTSPAKGGNTSKATRKGAIRNDDPHHYHPTIGGQEDYSELSALLSSRVENHVSFDCHVSIRRWAVLAFGWLCAGQKRLLEVGTVLLTRREEWGEIMESCADSRGGGERFASAGPAAAAGGAALAPRAAALARKKKKMEDTNTTTSSDSGGLRRSTIASSSSVPSGTQSLIIFVSCMIDMIYDAGATGGLSPPSSGWMDEYVKAVVGLPSEDADDDDDEEESKKEAEAAVAAAKESAAAAAACAAKESATAAATALAEPAGVRRSSRKRSKTTKGSNNDEANKKAAAAASASHGPRHGTSPLKGSPSKRGGSSSASIWIRPDIRDEVAVLTKVLMEAHLKCLNDSFENMLEKESSGSRRSSTQLKRLMLVNDDDSFHAISPSSRRRTTSNSSGGSLQDPPGSISSLSGNVAMCYYPFMHRTLETLGRTAASSSFHASSDGKGRIMSIGASVVLGCFFQSYEKQQHEQSSGAVAVLDAKLLSLAVNQLSECLEGMLLSAARMNHHVGTATTSTPSSSAVMVANIPQNVVAAYRLNDPLDVSMENAKQLARAAQRAAAATSSTNDNHGKHGNNGGNLFSSYGGAFALPSPEDKNQQSATAGNTEMRSFHSSSASSSSGRSNSAEILSLFVRAQVTPSSGGSISGAATTNDAYGNAMASILKCLLGIIQTCYDFEPDVHYSQGNSTTASSSDTTSTSLTVKKKAAKKKKRKASGFTTSVLETAGSGSGVTRQEVHPRRTYTRSVLASDALQTLTQALVYYNPNDDSRTTTSATMPPSSTNDAASTAVAAAMQIRSYFTKCLSTQMILDFSKLGYLLEEKLIGPRLVLVENEYSAALVAGTGVGSFSMGTTSFGHGPSGAYGGGSTATLSRNTSNSNMLEVSKAFGLWERQLWVCHIQLALTIGRCSASSLDVTDKLQVFHAIVEAEKKERTKKSDAGSTKQPPKKSVTTASTRANKSESDNAELWPLCLPAMQHALISSMILSFSKASAAASAMDEDSDENESRSELLFLCHSFLNSLESYCTNLSSHFSKTSSLKVSVSDNAPLSLRDARLFALSITQLSRTEQKKMLSRCIDILYTCLNDKNSLETLAEKNADSSSSGEEASHFIARGITLCASLVDVVSSPDLSSLLVRELESTNYIIPRLNPKQQHHPTNHGGNQGGSQSSSTNSLFNKELYQSLFTEWSSPSVPAFNISSTEMILESAGDYKKLKSTLLPALKLGFDTCLYDDCHLLFSAWNAIGKLTAWTSSTWDGPAAVGVMKKLDGVERVVRLREDMCEVYDLRTRGNGGRGNLAPQAETLLMRIVQSKALSRTIHPVDGILSGLNSAEKMFAFLTMEVGKENSVTPLLPTFAYYEALPIYVSFLISLHCRPGSNDCGLMHRFGTKTSATSSGAPSASYYSDESDGGGAPSSDCNNNTVLRTNALSRLHDACQSLGAAPCHPDWLDVNCRLSDGITVSIAVDSAERALGALTKFGIAVMKRYFGAMQRVLLLGTTTTEDDSMMMQVDDEETSSETYSAVALKLFFAQQQYPSDLCDSFYSQVSTLCQIQNDSVLKELIESISSFEAQDNCNLLATSAQRVKGADHTSSKSYKVFPGEHRANGQWETLLSEVLRGSSLTVVPSSDTTAATSDKSTTNDNKQQKVANDNAIAAVHHWRRVLYSIINAMVPAAALLRFGINNGKGRATHGLCEELQLMTSAASGSSSSLFRFPFTKNNNEVHNSASATIQKALSFLSCVSAYSCHDEDIRLVTRAAAGQLMENSNFAVQYNDLMGVWIARIACEAMDGACRIALSDSEKKELTEESRVSSAAYAIIEATLTQFADASGDGDVDETGMPIITMDDALDIDKRSTFLACLGMKHLKVGRLIIGSNNQMIVSTSADNVEFVDMLMKCDGDYIDPFSVKGKSNNEGISSWKSMMRGGDVTKLLLTLMCGKGVQHQLHVRSRIFVAEMLIDLMDAEFEIMKQQGKKSSSGGNSNNQTGVVRSAAASSLEELSKEDVLLLVQNLVSSGGTESPQGSDDDDDDLAYERKCLSEKTAIVVSYLATVSHDHGEKKTSLENSNGKIILDELLGCLDKWAGESSQQQNQHQHLIKLICLLASRFGALDEVGRKIVTLLKPSTTPAKTRKKGGGGNSKDVVGMAKQEEHYVDIARDFFEFVATMDRLVNQDKSTATAAAAIGSTTQVAKHGTATTAPTRSRVETSSSNITLKNGEVVPRTCSFVETGEGFTEQHWYNCYTCGLLWDKGCCSLCARVCHQGHDIGYSRKSSFFCDCGAEVATAIEQNRACKCLSPVSEDIIRELYEGNNESEDNDDELESSSKAAHDVPDIFTELIVKSFPLECNGSLQNLIEEAKTSEWRESILLLFNQCYQEATNPADHRSSTTTDFASLFSDTAPQANAGVAGLCPNLESRSAKPLALKRLNETSMVPIRAAKASTLQSRMVSSASSTSHIRKARNDIHLQTIAADNRGRLYIAESSSVLFCSAIPSVNVRYVENSKASHLSRSQLNVLGSHSVNFNINGMAICAENNRHLLLWGTSKACVAIVSKSLDSFERIIELKLNLEPSEECEYLVKCDWIPQSELQVVVVCGTVVHVFDLKRAENNSCNATTHYALAYEDVLIRSATLIGSLSVDDGSVIETKLALLLDTGRLYFISLTIDEEGNLEDHGESYIEIGAGCSFPSAGIRRYCGGDPVPKGSTATTFGEGVCLAYLRQSNLLLYQCVSSCCIAMLLDDDGAICGSFELLPNMISAEDIGGHYGVAGPYTHFQELGTVRRGSETFYRFSTVGRSTRSTQPRALVVEFNESSVSVKELAWPTNCSAGLGFISSYNFVGSCTFSSPYLVDETSYERAFLTMLSSSGSLLCFGEDCEHLAPGGNTHYLSHSTHHQAPPIGIFEKMINVSELDGLVYGGDFAGKDPKTIKKKLSLNSTDYVISPSRDGCTLTATLQIDSSSKIITDTRRSQGEDSTLAIVAVRVLVGSMPDLIPREIIIMGSGRSIKLKKMVKRWYDFPLTEEETLLALRNGFVTVWISSCHESSSTPIIDSVEVYARPRADLAFLQQDNGRDGEEMSKKLTQYPIKEEPSSEVLVACIQSLTFLTQIMGGQNALSAGSRDTISHIIQQTALGSAEKGTLRDQTIEFLSEAEGDVAKRTFMIDEATLHGLMSALQDLGKYLRTEFANVDVVSPKQEAVVNRAIQMLVQILNSTISIARTRGGNYRKVITELISTKACQSMAVEGKKILDHCQFLKTLHGANLKLVLPAQVVSELILVEIACSDSTNFAQFDTLSEYLVVDSAEIVKACCFAISNAIGNSVNKMNNISPEKDLSSEAGIITYQCDACLAFPITGRRYTLGGEMDIDLCKQCYDKGVAYARTHDQLDPVIINDRTLCVENEEMHCGKIWQMTSKPIAASSLKQAENAKKAGLLNNMAGAAKDTALKSIAESPIQSNNQEDDIGVPCGFVSSEGFRSQIFTQLLGLMTETLDAKQEDKSPPSIYVLQLVLDLVLGSCTDELKSARGKEMALAFTKNLSSLVKVCQSNDSSFTKNCSKLVVSLRTLAGLVLQKREINRSPPSASTTEEDSSHDHHHHKDKTDPRFICEVHGMPAVRRRCSHGVHKDRRFYVCGLERNQRCNYFKWSSDVPESTPTAMDSKSQDESQIFSRNDIQDIFVPVQVELQKILSENNLQEQFCNLVSDQFEKNEAVGTAPEILLANESASGASFPSTKTELEKVQDMDDGVYMSLEKFGKPKPMPSQLNEDDSLYLAAADGTKESFLCSSLDLFSLLAPKRKSASEMTDSPAWSSEWYSVLCEIISTGTSSVLRLFAKSMLQRLCGGRQAVYHRVRDHYVFGFQFRKLLQRSQDILDSALVVREQARQCGLDWRDEEVMYDTLPAGGLFGVEDLISEDWYAISTEESIAAVLDELLSAASRSVGIATKARSNNWRQFCGLHEMMAIPSRKGTSASVHGEILEMLDQIYRRPPIVSLLWLSSCLRGSNQVKALSLTDIALEDVNATTVKFQGDDADADEDDLLVGAYQTPDSRPSEPEQCLLKCFTVDDLVAFIKQFVLNGRAGKSIASNVARKLALRFDPPAKKCLFTCLIGGPFQEIGAIGNASNQFVDLLRLFVECFGSELDLSNVSSCIATSFVSQMTILNHYYGKNQGLFGKNDTELGGLSCNLSNCVHCQSPKKFAKSSNKKSETSVQSTTSVASNTNFLPEQVRPYQRGRLEASAATNVSTEFSSYNQLKFRVALSQVHVTVSDPRGRLVKTIGVYYSPRQVSDANILKSAKYTNLWQRCGTLSLARGASEATCKLSHDIVAANLKFTYEEFYEKASSKRAADGSFILHCPRCTRQVHNAHGVCGNCGEVAFQCRKCRHINYDRLDAFLCVECGYCTSGGFSYDITAGIAINAIAILDEDGFQRSMAMLGIANKRQADLRNSLKKKVMVTMQHQRKVRGDQVENLDEMMLYGPHLKRALIGGMPKSDGIDEDDESSKKPAGSSRTRGSSSSLSERASSTSNRARSSLLSLARSLRAEGGDGFGSRGDFLRQALLSAGGSGPSGFDSLDDTDLLSALSATGAGTPSSNDPLSRIVANIHARARDEGRSSRAAASGAGGGGGGGKSDNSRKDDKSKYSPSEERTRLYTQMREAERECYELNRRIDAWNRLNKDCLAGPSVQAPSTKTSAFMPSSCSACSMQMAWQILSLLHAVYAANISQSEHTVTSDLIKILLKESEILSPKLKDLKRRVVITLASTSEVASKMILAELQARLAAVQDVTSAEILGKLVALDFPSVDEYIELAMTTLTSLQGN